MLSKIAVNLTTTGLSAIIALLCTMGLVVNLNSAVYGVFGLSIMLINSVALLNIFRPKTLKLIHNEELTIDQSEYIAAGALGVAILISMLIFLFLWQTLIWQDALAVSIASFFSFTTGILADEIEGRGNPVLTTTSRNLLWLIFYPVALFNSSWFPASISQTLWVLAVGFFLLTTFFLSKAKSFRQISVLQIIHKDIWDILSKSYHAGVANFSALALGTADRIALWYVIPNSPSFGMYSAISDIFIRTHVFFRVVAAVVSSEITSKRVVVERLWLYIDYLMFFVFTLSLLLINFLPDILRPLGFNGRSHLFVASMFCTAIPAVALGYISAAILYAKGDVKSVSMSYAPFSVMFIISSMVVALYLDYIMMSVVYSVSRISDFVLLSKTDVRSSRITGFFAMYVICFMFGAYRYG